MQASQDYQHHNGSDVSGLVTSQPEVRGGPHRVQRPRLASTPQQDGIHCQGLRHLDTTLAADVGEPLARGFGVQSVAHD